MNARSYRQAYDRIAVRQIAAQKAAKPARAAKAKAKYERHRRECLAVNRGLDRQVRLKPVARPVPVSPPVHQVILTFPHVPGSMAYLLLSGRR